MSSSNEGGLPSKAVFHDLIFLGSVNIANLSLLHCLEGEYLGEGCSCHFIVIVDIVIPSKSKVNS